MHRLRKLAACCAALALLGSTGPATASLLHVDVQLGAPAPAGVVLAWDLIAGGAPGNQVTLANFASDAVPVGSTAAGDITGSLPGTVTLGDTAFFNELTLSLPASATVASFDFDATELAPGTGAVPDTFAFFVLDAATLLPLVPTIDPSGADSLFTLQIDGNASGQLAVYTPLGAGLLWSVGAEVPPPTAVPEPGSIALLLAGLLGAALVCGRRWRVALAWALALPLAAPATMHVTASGGAVLPHDGASWDSAFSASELPGAVQAFAGEEFWLARGAYPALANLPDGTQIYGGFRGLPLGLGETNRSQRDPVANPTYIDGVAIFPYFDPSGTQVFQGPQTVIDSMNIWGIGIRADSGAAPTLSNDSIHGAPYGVAATNGAGPTITDCEIEGAPVGVFVDGPRVSVQRAGKTVQVQPTIQNSTIRSSGSGSGSRVALWQSFNDPPLLVVSGSRFSDMTDAAALFLQGNAQLTGCTVENNSGNVGPAAVNITSGQPGQNVTLDGCTIRNNRATGLVVHPLAGSRIVFSHGEISGNEAPTPLGGNVLLPHAGGVQIGYDGVQIIASRIVNNHTTGSGGGVYIETNPVFAPTTQIVDTLIAGNQADLQGGGIWAGFAPFLVLNSTIADNAAAAGGGGVWLDASGGGNVPSLRFVNTAIVGNHAPKGSAIASPPWYANGVLPVFHAVATLTADTYASSLNLLPQSPPATADGNLVVADAGFVNPAGGDYHLALASLLLDRGDTSAINTFIQSGGQATDLGGQPRVVGAAVDVGAYETVQPGVINVTSQMRITRGGYVYNRAAQRYVQQVTLANASGGVLSGPISLVFDGLGQGITVAGQANVTAAQTPAGSPYVDISASDLVPAATLTLQIQFSDPFKVAIDYTPRVLSGPGPR